MTLRRGFREDSSETVDALIRIALRESVAGIEPSPQVWERIKERVRRLSTAKQSYGQVVFDQQMMLPSLIRASMPYLFVGSALRMC